MIGIFLRKTPQLWREMAYPAGILAKPIAVRGRGMHRDSVVVNRTSHTGMISLNRYPSPVGRHGYPQGRPPNFFLFEQKLGSHRQGFAGNVRMRVAPFPSGAGVARWRLAINAIQEQDKACRSNRYSSLSHRPLRLPAVATPHWSKASWGRAPVQRVPRFLIPAWPVAPLSVPSPTWPIASNTHRGVDATLCRVRRLSPSGKRPVSVNSCSKPEHKNRGNEHENRQNPGCDGHHRGNSWMFGATRNVQPLPIQPGASVASGHRLTPRTRNRVPARHQPNHTRNSVDRPWAAGAVLRSAP